MSDEKQIPDRGPWSFRVRQNDGTTRTLHVRDGEPTHWPSWQWSDERGRSPVQVAIGVKVLEVEGETGVHLNDGEDAAWFLAQWTLYHRAPERRRPTQHAGFAEHMLHLFPDRVTDAMVGDSAETMPDTSHADDLVRLSQVVPLVGRSKRTIQRYVREGRLRAPDVNGGEGQPNLWYWSKLRPELEELFHVSLPKHFPGSQILEV